jgi:dTDP-4-dehydrorhamnose 3,5-epimerase
MGSPHRIPDVVGSDELVAKQSAVNEQGKLRAVPIDGVIFRPARPVPHEDGHVTEVAHASWKELVDPVVQVHRANGKRFRIIVMFVGTKPDGLRQPRM